MKRFFLFIFLIIPSLAFADAIVPLGGLGIVLIPIISLIEFIAISLLFNYILKIKIRDRILLLVSVIANFVTSFFGAGLQALLGLLFLKWSDQNVESLSFFQMSIGGQISSTVNLIWLGTTFIISVIVEWIIYIPFLRKLINSFNLLKISFFANMISYGTLIALILWTSYALEK